MSRKIPHIFEDGIEKKRCSRCKEYLPLDNFIAKKDRADGLNNECDACRCIRNKRRANPHYQLKQEDLKKYNNKIDDKEE